jgi:hypothetical protein
VGSPDFFLSSFVDALLFNVGSDSLSKYPSPIARPARLSPNVDKETENAKIGRTKLMGEVAELSYKITNF